MNRDVDIPSWLEGVSLTPSSRAKIYNQEKLQKLVEGEMSLTQKEEGVSLVTQVMFF